MTAAIPTTEPATIAAGDTVKWSRSLGDYPASDGWTLSYEFVNSTHRFTATASASGADHLVTLSAATTGAYTAGWYDWRARASKSGEVYTIGTGRTQVLASFAAATDARGFSRTLLDKVETMLSGKATADVQSYQIQGRQLSKYTFEELLRLRSTLQAEVAREDAALAAENGQADRRRIYVRFGP